MSEFLGARISLISRSDIRYVGILHEINSDDSTVSLENVKSFGTEGRKGKPEEEVAPSDQVYEYIIFRGTDVKDLRIEEGPAAVKENKPPAMPSDPAIVNARPRQGNPPNGPPPNQQGPPGGFQYFPPPPMGGWGRGHPGPNGFNNMPYPPPGPQWFPPGQDFPPPMGPNGPGPWNNNFPFPPGPGGPPGPPGQGGRPGPNNQAPGAQPPASKPTPIGGGIDKKPATPSQISEMPSEPVSMGQSSAQGASGSAPPPPVESKPTAEEVKATAAFLHKGQDATKQVPTGPKNSRPSQIMPAVPLPTALTSKSHTPQAGGPKMNDNSAAALRDATQAAKAAVAVAMAQVAASASAAQQLNGSGTAMDNLTKQVNEMRVNAARGGSNSRGGRGRGPRGGKVDVPDSDFDFASANAKFNKQEVGKEAVAGSPLTEAPNGGAATPEIVVPGEQPESTPVAYNKSRSFFDNISSEAKDRSENNGQKPGGREWRGEEQRKNMETFGQGSVDGGFRGYRGRGRGRGGRGRGFGRGGRGGGGGFRPAQPVAQ